MANPKDANVAAAEILRALTAAKVGDHRVSSTVWGKTLLSRVTLANGFDALPALRALKGLASAGASAKQLDDVTLEVRWP